jgi:hypothetical protein
MEARRAEAKGGAICCIDIAGRAQPPKHNYYTLLQMQMPNVGQHGHSLLAGQHTSYNKLHNKQTKAMLPHLQGQW